MMGTYRTLNDCEMQLNVEVGLFTRLSNLVYRTSRKNREKDVGKKAKGALDPEAG
jgi:hypothetical protein